MISTAVRVSARWRPSVRYLQSPNRSLSTTSLEEHEADTRVKGLVLNPDSVVSKILPGGESVLKLDKRTAEYRKVFVDREYGFFWRVSDLSKVGSKPILSNTELIPEDTATDFPELYCLQSLETDKFVDIPEYFTADNRAKDPTSQCTLVTISFKDHGYQLLPSWIEPFEEAFGVKNPRAKAMRISITEGRFAQTFLTGAVTRTFRHNVPPELYSQTLLYFGVDGLKRFIDKLRMYNTLTGYAFLLDGLGRVRFAGSGEATADEASAVINFAQELTPRLAKKTGF